MEAKKFLRGFGYAGKGILTALNEERNLRFHLCAAGYVFWLAGSYDFSRAERLLLVLLVCGVLALEMMNSAVERAVDKPAPQHWYSAGAAKDMAAGAVLVFSMGAAACGIMLFWQPAVLKEVFAGLWARPARLCALAASLLAAWCFVFEYEKIKRALKRKK